LKESDYIIGLISSDKLIKKGATPNEAFKFNTISRKK